VKLSRDVTVKNSLGLHARPAAVIAKMLQGVKASVSFTYESETINAKSIMSILMLAAGKNSIIRIDIDGEGAEELMNKLSLAFDQGFGE
jgi:phosphocarrier protein